MDGGADITIVVRNRTLRRHERAIRITELVDDMEKVEQALLRTNNKRHQEGLEKLLAALYHAYCDVVDSEV